MQFRDNMSVVERNLAELAEMGSRQHECGGKITSSLTRREG